jgi:predicted lipoprotein with Yx(FWY)xxD motif
MKRKLTLLVAAAAPVVIALVVAGCGGSTYGSSPAGPAAKASDVAKLAVVGSPLGRIVIDSTSGLTLYMFEKDTDGRSACSGQCATYWPPLLTNAAPVARGGVAPGLLGTTHRADGSEQVTFAGHPLYRYFGDSNSGQTNGEGSQEFGAEWNVLSPAGKEIESDD